MVEHRDYLDLIQGQIDYFTDNKERMKYDVHRASRLPIGSDTIESACKNGIAGRMKQGGMTWSETGQTECYRSAAPSPVAAICRISWPRSTGRHESTYLLESRII